MVQRINQLNTLSSYVSTTIPETAKPWFGCWTAALAHDLVKHWGSYRILSSLDRAFKLNTYHKHLDCFVPGNRVSAAPILFRRTPAIHRSNGERHPGFRITLETDLGMKNRCDVTVMKPGNPHLNSEGGSISSADLLVLTG